MRISFLILTFLVFFVSACNQPRSRPTFFNETSSDVTSEGEETSEESENTLPIPERPSGQVELKPGFCACQAGEPIILGNCDSFCSSKTNEEPLLYLDYELGEKITEGSLGNLVGWCGSELIDPNTGETVDNGGNPSCALKAIDENGNASEINIENPSQKPLVLNISALNNDLTYRLTITEVTSGATGSTIQLRKREPGYVDPVGGPLRSVPVFQYTCIKRDVENDNIDNFFISAERNHFYFNTETRPEPLPQTFDNFFCHDIIRYGSIPRNDPLLEERTAFAVWSRWDPRFSSDGTDSDASILIIDKIIQQKVIDQGFNMPSPPKLFSLFNVANGATTTGEDSSNFSVNALDMGYFMTPFIDQGTFKAYCPKNDNYNSSNPLFRALKDLFGKETEAIYVAKQENVDNDFIYIRESEVKPIWFYTEGGINIQPNNESIIEKQVKFYWPADYDTPYIKKSHQRVFYVKTQSEIFGDSAPGQQDGSGNSFSYRPHDKRLGCIPISSDTN